LVALIHANSRHLFTYDQLAFLEPYISSNSTSFLNNRSESPVDRPALSHQNSSSDAGSGRASRADAVDDFSGSTLASNLNQLLLQLAAQRDDDAADSKASSKTPRLNGNANGAIADSLPLTNGPSRLPDLETAKRKRRLIEEEGSVEKRQNGDAEAEIAALNASVLCLSRCLEEVLPKAGEDECAIFGRQIANDLRQVSVGFGCGLLGLEEVCDSL
jgi:hypothetical protein